MLTYMLEEMKIGYEGNPIKRVFNYEKGLIFDSDKSDPIQMEEKHKIFGIQIGVGKVEELTKFRCATNGLRDILSKDALILTMASDSGKRITKYFNGDSLAVVEESFHGTVVDFSTIKESLKFYIKEMSKLSVHLKLMSESYTAASEVRKNIKYFE